MTIEFSSGKAVRRKTMVSVRDRFTITLDGAEITVHGDILSKEYALCRNGEMFATVSRKWFTVRHTYGFSVGEGVAPEIPLALAVGLDALTRAR